MAKWRECLRRLSVFPCTFFSMNLLVMLTSACLTSPTLARADTSELDEAIHYQLNSIAAAKKVIEAQSVLDEISMLLYLPLTDRPVAAKVIQQLGFTPELFLEKYVLPFNEGYSDGTHVILASETLEGITEPSLAFVLAHEMGHNKLRSHILKVAKAHEIGLATCPHPCKANDFELIDLGFSKTEMWPKNFFWQNEFDADRWALTLLRKVGFNDSPRALIEGISSAKKAMETGSGTGYGITHPSLETRIRAMEEFDRQLSPSMHNATAEASLK